MSFIFLGIVCTARQLWWSVPLIDTWSTLTDRWLTPHQHLSWQFVESQLTLDWCIWLLNKCWLSVHQMSTGMSIECWSRFQSSVNYRLFEGIDRHSTTDAFSKHDLFLSVYSVNSLSGESQKPIWIVKHCIQYVLFPLLPDIQNTHTTNNKDMTASFTKIWPSVIN